MKFHLNGAGEAGKCKAEKGNCPFGGDSEHFTTAEGARAHYEKNMSSAPQSISKSKRGVPDLPPQTQAFSKPEIFDYAKEHKRIDDEWTNVNRGADTDYKKRREVARESFAKAQAALVARVAAATTARYPGSLKEALDSAAITKDSPAHDLPQRQVDALSLTLWLPKKDQEKFYALPVTYLDAFTSDKEGATLPEAGMKKLIAIAATVHENDPSFSPKDLHVLPRVARQYRSSGFNLAIPQMQHTRPKTYSLLNEYAVQKYGARADDFWFTVSSNSVNHPKLSDFARAEKEFDKLLNS